MFSNAKDVDFAQHIIRMRQQEQDGTVPDSIDLTVNIDGLGDALDGEELKIEAKILEAEEEPVNFMTRLYEDERFVQEKVMLEEQIMEASQTAVEGKNFIQEMDEFLKDLDQWKNKRSAQDA